MLKDISEEIFSIINLGIICLYEHYKVDGHIGDLAVFVNFVFVGEDGSSRDVVVGIVYFLYSMTIYTFQ